MYFERIPVTVKKVKLRNEGCLDTGAIPKYHALHIFCKAKSAISNGNSKSMFYRYERVHRL